LVVLAIVLLLIFGPKRLPEIGKSMGKGMREFKQSVSGITGEDEATPSVTPAKPELPAAVDPHA
jgi:sec-independent protein translocase protein TatA